MIKIILIEDNFATLKYLEALLSASGEIQVLGTFASGGEIFRTASWEGLVPDVFVVDLNLPDISGIEVIRHLRYLFEKAEILVLTMHDDREHLFASLKAGATGYILKGTGAAEIIRAITDVARGGSPMSPGIARRIIEEFNGRGGLAGKSLLTEKEREVLREIANGLSERKVAEVLSLSPHTVHSHIKSIYRKLQVRSKTEAVLKAKTQGII